MNGKIKLTGSLFLLAGLLLTGCVSMRSPLVDAINRGDTPAVKTLLDAGENVNEVRSGCTPLLWAADKGNVEMVKLLIAKGADVNLRSGFGGTALSTAAANGHSEVVDLLMDNGADMDWAIKSMEQHAVSCRNMGVSDVPLQKTINQLKQNQKNFAGRTGWACYCKGEFEKGLTAFKQAIQQNPADAGSFAGLAACHDSLEQYEEAVTAAKQAIVLNPQLGNGHLRLGIAYAHLKKNGEAEKELKLAIDLDPKDPNLYRPLIMFYFETAQYQEALALGNKFERILPPNSPLKSDAIHGAMICYFGLGKYDEAIADADRFIDYITRQPATQSRASYGYAMKSLSYREKGDSKQADENAQKAMELNPADERSHLSAGKVAMDKEQFAEAIKILSPYPTNNITLATAYAKLERFDVAAKLYLDYCDDVKLRKSVPGLKALKIFLASMRPYTQKLLDNAKQLEASQQPDAALAELAKAVAVSEEEHVEEVRIRMFRLAQKSQPKEPEGAYRYAKRGDILVGEGNPQGAINEYNKALKMAPYSPRLYFNAALIHGSLKNYAKAMEYMKTYVQLVPSAPNIQAARDALIEWELKMEI